MHAINLLRTLLPIHLVNTDYLKSERHFRTTEILSVTGTLTGFLREKTKKDKEESYICTKKHILRTFMEKSIFTGEIQRGKFFRVSKKVDTKLCVRIVCRMENRVLIII